MSGPSDIETLLTEARRRLRRRQPEHAIALFEQARALDDSRQDIHEGLALAHLRLGRYEEAAQHFRRVTELCPHRAAGYVNRGAVLNRMGEHAAAIAVLKQAVQKDCNSAEAFYNLGYAYRQLNELGMARTAYREVIRLNPGMAEAHQHLANVYLASGNNQQAIAYFNKALEIRPDFEQAHQGLRKARQAVERVNRSIGPFGRLVDAEQYRGRQLLSAHRALNDDERYRDRESVRLYLQAIQEAAAEFLAHLTQTLQPALLQVQRDLREGREWSRGFCAKCDEFSIALARSAELRRTLRQRIARLKAHEELMRGSGAQPPATIKSDGRAETAPVRTAGGGASKGAKRRPET